KDGKYTTSENQENTQVSIGSIDKNEINNEISKIDTDNDGVADDLANTDRLKELNQIKNGLISYNQIDADMKIEISQGVIIDYNKTASEILEFTDPEDPTRAINVADLFNNIIGNLNSEDGKEALTGENLADLDKAISNLLTKSSEVGAMQNRMESAANQNETENENLTTILSSVEDIDFTEKMIDFSTLMTVYKASLQISANILPKTIMDYL
ncbi:MAG: flagellin, partial [Clostridium sp.]|nr:flagellin [Clostridium sp.]